MEAEKMRLGQRSHRESVGSSLLARKYHKYVIYNNSMAIICWHSILTGCCRHGIPCHPCEQQGSWSGRGRKKS